MAKANCGASMKPQQKNTPKMAMGGMMDSNKRQGTMGRSTGMGRGPQSVQAMTAQSTAGARRQQRKYS